MQENRSSAQGEAWFGMESKTVTEIYQQRSDLDFYQSAQNRMPKYKQVQPKSNTKVLNFWGQNSNSSGQSENSASFIPQNKTYVQSFQAQGSAGGSFQFKQKGTHLKSSSMNSPEHLIKVNRVAKDTRKPLGEHSFGQPSTSNSDLSSQSGLKEHATDGTPSAKVCSDTSSASEHEKTAAAAPAPAQPVVRRLKYEMCKNWREKGECKYGVKCLFAHGEEELTKRGTQPATTEAPKTEPVKTEPVKADTVKTELVKTDTVKTDGDKTVASQPLKSEDKSKTDLKENVKSEIKETTQTEKKQDSPKETNKTLLTASIKEPVSLTTGKKATDEDSKSILSEEDKEHSNKDAKENSLQ